LYAIFLPFSAALFCFIVLSAFNFKRFFFIFFNFSFCCSKSFTTFTLHCFTFIDYKCTKELTSWVKLQDLYLQLNPRC
jgi:amino acid permease